jgi:diguanylate cyclase (GGDEF)-like protein
VRVLNSLFEERRISYGLMAALLLLLVISGVSLVSLIRLHDMLGEERRSSELAILLNSLSGGIQESHRGERNYLVSGDEAHLKGYVALTESYASNVEALRRLVPNQPRQLENIEKLDTLIHQEFRAIQESISARQMSDHLASLPIAPGGFSGKAESRPESLSNGMPSVSPPSKRKVGTHKKIPADSLPAATRETAIRPGVSRLLVSVDNHMGRLKQIRQILAESKKEEQGASNSRIGAAQATFRNGVLLLSFGTLVSSMLLVLVFFVLIRKLQDTRESERQIRQSALELEGRNQEIAPIAELVEMLQTCLTSEEAYGIIAQALKKVFPRARAALYLMKETKDALEAVSHMGECPMVERSITPDACWALRRGRPHLVTDPKTAMTCQHPNSESTPPHLCIPLMAHGEALGVLSLQYQLEIPEGYETEQQVEAFMATKQRLAQAVTENIGLALANLKLREALRNQSICDPLTGLFNRRYMEETLERELRRAERKQLSLGIVMIDLDHFKSFNDNFGHEAGDLLLCEFSHYVQNHIRREDVPCRYGGEEFVLIIPESSLEATRRRGEQIRQAVKQLHVEHRGRALGQVTTSVGVAIFPNHGSTAKSLLRVADAALYRAKSEGRDRVVVGDAASDVPENLAVLAEGNRGHARIKRMK